MTMSFNHKRTWGPEARYPLVCSYGVQPQSELIIIAGPCSIESPEQVEVITDVLRGLPITFMRGGVFRAGTYPTINYGLQRDIMF